MDKSRGKTHFEHRKKQEQEKTITGNRIAWGDCLEEWNIPASGSMLLMVVCWVETYIPSENHRH